MNNKRIIIIILIFLCLSLSKAPNVLAYSSSIDDLAVAGTLVLIVDGLYYNTGATTPNGDYIYKSKTNLFVKWNNSDSRWEIINESGEVYYYTQCPNPTCSGWNQAPLGSERLPSLIWIFYNFSDSDNDGVIDQWDLCSGTPPNSSVDSTGCKSNQKAVVVPLF